MENLYKKLLEDKKEYREQMKRVHALPKDYQFVYEKMQNYMWSFAGGSGMDMLKTQYDLIDFLEEGALQGKHVLAITGEDVASFCDDLIAENKLWMNRKRDKLNNDIMRKNTN